MSPKTPIGSNYNLKEIKYNRENEVTQYDGFLFWRKGIELVAYILLLGNNPKYNIGFHTVS